MNLSKQFIPKNTSTSHPRHSNVKVWGKQNKQSTFSLNRANSDNQINKFKSFTADKDKISKIFAPKLTVIDNNILVGNKKDTKPANKITGNWQNPNSKVLHSEKVLNPKNNQEELEVKINTNKITNFLNLILPKISIGRHTFGGIKTETPKPIIPLVVEKNSSRSTILNSDIAQNKYDPEAIFNKLNLEGKHDSKANFFHYIKTSLNKSASNWWESTKFDFYDKQWFRKLNYQFVAFDIAKNINRLILGICILSFIGFFTYLSFFDQYFTIKKYTVEYINGSYLNNQQTFDLITHFQKNKLYRVFPNNQYWFANNLSLTASAKELFPEVKSINIKNRQWPDKILLQVETNKPILTIWVTENNEQKYWRINEDGKISSQDKAAIWYNLVKVEKPYSVQGDPSQQLSLFDHSFENDPSQKQRFKLTKRLLDYFQSIDIKINSTTFPSISDTDIIMESEAGTKFLFDSLAFETDLQIQRLDYFLKSKSDKNDFYELHKKSSYTYFDFRIAHKAHVCKINEKCNVKTEEETSK